MSDAISPQRSILLHAFKQVQVLVSDDSVGTYTLVQNSVEDLRRVSSAEVGGDTFHFVSVCVRVYVCVCVRVCVACEELVKGSCLHLRSTPPGPFLGCLCAPPRENTLLPR
jgi:hypothetical protein